MPTENQQDYDQLLESSSTTIENQRKVIALLQSRLREEREKFEAQLAELQQRLDTTEQNPPPAIGLPEPADLLNQLKAKNPKSKASLGDADAMVEIIEEFWKTHPRL